MVLEQSYGVPKVGLAYPAEPPVRLDADCLEPRLMCLLGSSSPEAPCHVCKLPRGELLLPHAPLRSTA